MSGVLRLCCRRGLQCLRVVATAHPPTDSARRSGLLEPSSRRRHTLGYVEDQVAAALEMKTIPPCSPAFRAVRCRFLRGRIRSARRNRPSPFAHSFGRWVCRRPGDPLPGRPRAPAEDERSHSNWPFHLLRMAWKLEPVLCSPRREASSSLPCSSAQELVVAGTLFLACPRRVGQITAHSEEEIQIYHSSDS